MNRSQVNAPDIRALQNKMCLKAVISKIGSLSSCPVPVRPIRNNDRIAERKVLKHPSHAHHIADIGIIFYIIKI